MHEVDRFGATRTHPAKCARCAAELISPLVCVGCHTLNPSATSRNYFELLGLPQDYAIDEARLESAYRKLASAVHPDRFAAGNAEELSAAVRTSAAINQAYVVLRDPLRRADYLLELSGGPSAAAIRDVPGTFLADVMQRREEIDDAKTTGDEAALARLRDLLAERRKSTDERIRGTAVRLPEVDEPSRTELRRLLNSMKYIDNLLAEAAADPFAKAEPGLDG